MLAALSAPSYLGPEVQSVEAVKGFLSDTLSHVRRVTQLTKSLGADAKGHDIAERVPLARVEALVTSLKAKAATNPALRVDWVEALVAQAKREGATTLNVGKLSPQVAAGLGRTGPPDLAALELHRLSAHHAAGSTGAKLETIADLVDAIVSPRGYKQGLSHEAAGKVIGDMIERGQVNLRADDLPTVHRALGLHRQAFGPGAATAEARP